MTSSLVGSEMCIRDRSKIWQQSLPRLVATISLSATFDVERSLGERAVSYTHLTLPTICSV
eukprot:8694111-Prorocentrum_lima.AAC.1